MRKGNDTTETHKYPHPNWITVGADLCFLKPTQEIPAPKQREEWKHAHTAIRLLSQCASIFAANLRSVT